MFAIAPWLWSPLSLLNHNIYMYAHSVYNLGFMYTQASQKETWDRESSSKFHFYQLLRNKEVGTVLGVWLGTEQQHFRSCNQKWHVSPQSSSNLANVCVGVVLEPGNNGSDVTVLLWQHSPRDGSEDLVSLDIQEAILKFYADKNDYSSSCFPLWVISKMEHVHPPQHGYFHGVYGWLIDIKFLF